MNEIGIVSVPTATIIGYHATDPSRVFMLRPASKHGGKLVLPGGRVKLGKQDAIKCALDEWDEELGGKGAQLVHPRVFAVATDFDRDVREISWAKFQHDLCPEDARGHRIQARYGVPDTIVLAEVNGDPWPKDGEAKSVELIDVNNPPDASAIGAGHDAVLAVYRHFLLTEQDPPAFALAHFPSLRECIGTDGFIEYARLSEMLFGR